MTAKRIYENTESLQFHSEPQIKKLLNKIPTSSQGYEEITLVELQTLKNTVLNVLELILEKTTAWYLVIARDFKSPGSNSYMLLIIKCIFEQCLK